MHTLPYIPCNPPYSRLCSKASAVRVEISLVNLRTRLVKPVARAYIARTLFLGYGHDVVFVVVVWQRPELHGDVILKGLLCTMTEQRACKSDATVVECLRPSFAHLSSES
jgi:hypothetical protein